MHDVLSLAIVVDKMLHARQESMRTASPTAMDEYARLERQVRGMVREVINDRQKGLFDGN